MGGTVNLTEREAWTLIHGMVLGAFFLLGFAGGLAGLYSYSPAWLNQAGIRERVLRLDIGIGVMAVALWLTVIVGTWVVYPWYRAPMPKEVSDAVSAAQRGGQPLTHEQVLQLQQFPRNYLLASPELSEWHTFGMEWKEHVAWMAPVLVTVVFFGVLYYGRRLAYEPGVRRFLMVVYIASFVTAAIAGLFGALITKAAPIL
jgi:hypothetical protein